MAHSAVVEALAARGPVVPVQFGIGDGGRGQRGPRSLGSRSRRLRRLLHRPARTHQFNAPGDLRPGPGAGRAGAEPSGHRRAAPPYARPAGGRHAPRPGPARASWSPKRWRQARRGRRPRSSTVLPPHVARRGTARRRWGGRTCWTSRCSSRTTRCPSWRTRLEMLAEALHERIRLRLIWPVAPYDFVEEGRWA